MVQYGNMFEELAKELEQANRNLSKIVIMRKTSSEEIKNSIKKEEFMGNKDLINNLKERIDVQVENYSSVSKANDIDTKLFEQGFAKEYISAINYVNAMLEQNKIINLDEFLDLNEFIAESLDKANGVSVVK